MLAAQTLLVGPALRPKILRPEENLGGDDQVLAAPRSLGDALVDGSAHVPLGEAAAVRLGVVEEVDAVLEGELHHVVPGVGRVLVVDVHPAAERELGDQQARVAQEAVGHAVGLGVGRGGGHGA
ncbi:hypothetical protein ON010_g1166 [Phytophthora cinnamomi]|nr:hypothetical protein ON010_g1166 [Phytophthora cinnamomi]